MAAPKLTQVQQATAKRVIAKLDRRWWTQTQIRDELKREHGIDISQPMVGIYKRQLHKEIVEDYKREKKDADAEMVDRLCEVIRNAWHAYDLSMADETETREEFADQSEQVSPDDYVTSERRIKRIVTVAGRLPENAYLTTVLKAMAQIADIRGLVDKGSATSNTLNVVVAGAEFWSGLAKQVAAAMPLAVEARVVQAIEVDDASTRTDTTGAGEGV